MGDINATQAKVSTVPAKAETNFINDDVTQCFLAYADKASVLVMRYPDPTDNPDPVAKAPYEVKSFGSIGMDGRPLVMIIDKPFQKRLMDGDPDACWYQRYYTEHERYNKLGYMNVEDDMTYIALSDCGTPISMENERTVGMPLPAGTYEVYFDPDLYQVHFVRVGDCAKGEGDNPQTN